MSKVHHISILNFQVLKKISQRSMMSRRTSLEQWRYTCHEAMLRKLVVHMFARLVSWSSISSMMTWHPCCAGWSITFTCSTPGQFSRSVSTLQGQFSQQRLAHLAATLRSCIQSREDRHTDDRLDYNLVVLIAILTRYTSRSRFVWGLSRS